mmetsp:Transcript_4974/g.7801  ORF Transcript_4974/g.7801 Transcript_4974/m.7801 type:complete len:242 (-) Transcript_4974:173-898(-)
MNPNICKEYVSLCSGAASDEEDMRILFGQLPLNSNAKIEGGRMQTSLEPVNVENLELASLSRARSATADDSRGSQRNQSPCFLNLQELRLSSTKRMVAMDCLSVSIPLGDDKLCISRGSKSSILSCGFPMPRLREEVISRRNKEKPRPLTDSKTFLTLALELAKKGSKRQKTKRHGRKEMPTLKMSSFPMPKLGHAARIGRQVKRKPYSFASFESFWRSLSSLGDDARKEAFLRKVQQQRH